MQSGRGGRDSFFDFDNHFAGFGGFGGFGGQRSLLSTFFGGRDPFDDPFFRQPFGGMFGSNIFGPTGNPFTDARTSGFLDHQVPQPNQSRGPIIEELNSGDEKEEDKEKKDNPRKHGRSSDEPYVEDPDDEFEGVAVRKSKQMQYQNNFNRVNSNHLRPHTHGFTFQSSTVSYGGANGAYYTSSRTRRTGSDGLTFEETKEANTATGQAAHQISRGIYDKGHTVSRNLKSDGRVDTMQTLHNLNEDELPGFEEAWKGNARKHLPGWSDDVHDVSGISANIALPRRGGWALPSTGHLQHSGSVRSDGERVGPSRSQQHSGRMKAIVGDRARSSRGSPRSATPNMDQSWRH